MQSKELRKMIRFFLNETKANPNITASKIKLLWKIKESEETGLLPKNFMVENVTVKGKLKSIREHIYTGGDKTVKLIETAVSKKVKANILKEGLNQDQKQKCLEDIKNFNRYAEAVYRNSKLKELAENIENIVEFASKYAVENAGEWFDAVSINRNMKGLKESASLFAKTCKEATILQQRLESLYEDIGTSLGRYFEIADGEPADNGKKLSETKVTPKAGTPDARQLGVLLKTLKMNPAMAAVMGGPNQEEAIKILKTKFGYSDADIKKLSESNDALKESISNKSLIKEGQETYKLRCEAPSDVIHFLRLCWGTNGIREFSMPTADTFLFRSDLPIDKIIELLKKVPDGHVMVRTVAKSNEFTGREIRDERGK